MAGDGDDETARDWAIRSADPAFEDWDALTDWLAADPVRADRYHHAAANLPDMTDLLRHAPAPVPAPTPALAPARRRRWWPAGVATAVAAAAAVLFVVGDPDPAAQPYAVETAAGATRTVALADGSRIALAGGTRLILDHADTRLAALERGQALFTIRHDAQHPFRVRVGGEELIDTGTVFDVARAATGLRVAVAEGGVMVDPAGERLALGPGDRLEVKGARRVVSRVAVASVGAWERGQLSYLATPLGTVAAEVGQALGLRITVAPAVATRPFTGTVALDGIRRDPASLGALVDVAMVRRGDGWELGPGS